MHDRLRDARVFANQLKYSGDLLDALDIENAINVQPLIERLYANELSISPSVTPDLYKSLKSVLLRIDIPENSVNAFVYASSEINAQCFSDYDSKCIIRISSGLIELLNYNEFEFVVGHEIGHFLFTHSHSRAANHNSDSIEHYMLQRAQEISADRIGLVTCDSLDVAIKALIKTTSGLSDRYLRFDVGAFVSQLKMTSEMNSGLVESTHPSILLRCRALLWFSLNSSYINQSKKYDKSELNKLDRRIKKDIDKYADQEAKRIIDEAKCNYEMWKEVLRIVEDGLFAREEQTRFMDKFGEDLLESTKRFLNSLSSSEACEVVSAKLNEAEGELKALIPYEFQSQFMN